MLSSRQLVPNEHDGCGLWAWVARDGKASPQAVRIAVDALTRMDHRAGLIDGEGDGAGLLTDLPRPLWARRLAQWGQDPSLAEAPDFGVGHFLARDPEALERRLEHVAGWGVKILGVGAGAVDEAALGPQARSEQLTFVQVAWQGPLSWPLLEWLWSLEGEDLAVCSWSHDTVVYKIRGTGAQLGRYYRDLTDPLFASVAVVGHVRYSTNTTTRAARAQPFRILGHNGEINTIARLRKTAQDLGFKLPEGGSDSQDLSRLVEGLLIRDGLTLEEAMLALFPPVAAAVRELDGPLAAAWTRIRAALGPVAQGPAAVIARHGARVLGSQDALGLRPLWLIQTADAYVLASEQGALPLTFVRTAPPVPLGPGEKVLIRWDRGETRLERTPALEDAVALRLAERLPESRPADRPMRVWTPSPVPADLGALGFEQADLEILEAMTEGKDPIGSLGYDGPLPALDRKAGLIADYLQETVAVVTNPAIDRERETFHFSTDVHLGARPWLDQTTPAGLLLSSPLLLDTWTAEGHRPQDAEVLAALPLEPTVLPLRVPPDRTVRETLQALEEAAVAAVRGGSAYLLLDDEASAAGYPLDPALGAAAVARALEREPGRGHETLRRQAAILVRSGLLRRLHDIAVTLGVGADAVLPYRLWAEAERLAGADGVRNTAKVLRQGLEKVISTVGIHEFRGYGPLFSAIGLAPEVADLLEVPLLVPGRVTFEVWGQAMAERYATGGGPKRPYHLYPKIFKLAQSVAQDPTQIAAYQARLTQLEEEQPVALRHVLDVAFPEEGAIDPSQVSIAVGEHRMPFVIGSMSFGSQGETAYRAYLKGAALAGIIAMNGEGGEIPDLVPLYRNNRGIQVASGRFGITAQVVGTARYLEIKIGQGAKPGEGGHLPAKKVSPAVARARRSQVGIDLISPSNNHDLYSIEDLAQLIYELKTVAPDARVAVKVPVVPGIGTIAVGIAKAGADIINLSGYEGGTGAARRHAQRFVGLPSDLGTVLVHRALVAAGLRHRVEIWADGGMRSPLDVLKLVLLGANRVGFGTLAMVAIGCTICRACQTDTCHVGIATQIRTVEEAQAHGLKRFVPREEDAGAQALAQFFLGMGEHLKALVARLGVRRLQDLVGRASLLVQTRGTDLVDLSDWLRDVPIPLSLAASAIGAQGTGRALQVAIAGSRTRSLVQGDLALEEEEVVRVVGVASR
ncbi:MAG: glutamate synthase [Actinomycetia bacterium]|nr:glutamate synthase [Actinomycetes bacterium]